MDGRLTLKEREVAKRNELLKVFVGVKPEIYTIIPCSVVFH